MSHQIQGVVASKEVLAHAAGCGFPDPVRPLDVGMGFVPVTEAALTALSARYGEGDADGRFGRLGWGVPAALAQLSAHGALVYLETEYVGGVGEQSATVYAEGARVIDTCTINEALRRIGVVARAEMDEWDTIGLGDYRHMPDE